MWDNQDIISFFMFLPLTSREECPPVCQPYQQILNWALVIILAGCELGHLADSKKNIRVLFSVLFDSTLLVQFSSLYCQTGRNLRANSETKS